MVGTTGGVIARPPAADIVWLAVAVLFISSSGPIIAAMAVPASPTVDTRTPRRYTSVATWQRRRPSGAVG